MPIVELESIGSVLSYQQVRITPTSLSRIEGAITVSSAVTIAGLWIGSAGTAAMTTQLVTDALVMAIWRRGKLFAIELLKEREHIVIYKLK